jgi:type II secretory pathway component PulJ
MTLLELILAMAISVIVVMMIIAFISGALRVFRKTNNEVNLQMEAQTTMNQLTGLLMEASMVTESMTDPDRYYIANVAGYGLAVIFDRGGSRLYLVELGSGDNYETVAFTEQENLLAEYVKEFSIIPEDGALYKINLKLQIDEQDMYKLESRVELRNYVTPTPTPVPRPT